MRAGFHFLRLVLPFFSLTAALRAQDRPPVILITIDTLRADHLPMWGAADVRTPALQALARQAVLFRQTVAPAPLTVPSHASLLTGTYPQFHGVRDNTGNRLPRGIPILASLLKAQGYLTAAFLGSAVLDRQFGLNEGFDYYGDRFPSRPKLSGVVAERTAGAVIEEAMGWLTKHGLSAPFFMWIHLYDPHAPYKAPGQLGQLGYKGEIQYVDAQLEKFFRFLNEKHLYTSSLLAVLSDHGEDLNQHGEPTHGFFIYDTVLLVPFILKFPGNRFAGRQVNEQVRIVDVLPTVLQVLELPASAAAQGAGLMGFILGKRNESLPAYGESLYANLHFGWSTLLALRTERYKYIDAPQPELYDVRADPGETRNLYSVQQALAHRLKEELDRIRARYEGRATEKVSLDPELQEKLKSLGYITLSTGHPIVPKTGQLPDPKAKIEIYAEIYKGMQAYGEEKLEVALGHFRTAVARDPSLAVVYDYMGSTYLELKRHSEAIAAYKKAVELSPQQAHSNKNLAYAYLQTGQLEEAVAALERLVRLDSNDWQGWHFLGVALAKQNRADQAVAAFQAALQRNPQQLEVLFNLGTLYQQQEQFLMAVQTFKRLVELAPDDADAWNSLATNYQNAGNAEAAEKAYRRAIAANPKFALAHYNYGNLFARRGQWEQAAGKYRDALQMEPNFALAHKNLAVVLEMMGRKQEAAVARRAYERLTGEKLKEGEPLKR